MNKKLLKSIIFVGVSSTAMILTGCSQKVESDSLYVEKVENMKGDFIMSMDSSSVISLEQSGVKYYDFDGNEADVFKILADNGVNNIRVRVWNDPFDENGNGYGGGNCTINTALEIGKRATSYGMSLLVDFHYSDFWADPDRQTAPKAWKNLEIEDKADALYKYTKESLELLKDNGVKVNMVQIGNETNGGRMCGEKSWFNTANWLMNAGSKAVREVLPDAKIAVHFTNPEKTDNMLDYASKLAYYEVDYDVFGTSYYPYWHGTLENLATTLNAVSETYDKDVMVLETSYPYNSVDADFNGNVVSEDSGIQKDYVFSVAGQANHIRNLADTLVNDVDRALGLSYWEGTWIPVGTSSWEENVALWGQYGSGWANKAAAGYDTQAPTANDEGCTWENQAFFDSTGHPLESLKVFNLVRHGNTDVDLYVDGVENLEEICYVDDDEYQLPTTVNAIYNSNERIAKPVTWDLTSVQGYDYAANGEFTVDKIRELGNADYIVPGTVEGFKTTLALQVMEHNYVENYSFENGKTITPWVLKQNNDKAISSNYVLGVTNENPKTGTYAFHTWANNAKTVNWDITQELALTKSGTYKYQFSMLGGTAGAADPAQQNIYAYVLIDGVEVEEYRTYATITKWADGYRNYQFEGIAYEAGHTVTLGFHVEEPEAGFWCDLDDVMFNIVED